MSVLGRAENTNIFCMDYACAPGKERWTYQSHLYFEQLPGQVIDVVKVLHCIDPAPYKGTELTTS